MATVPNNPFAHLDAPVLPRIEMLKIFLAFISGVLVGRLVIAASIVICMGGFVLLLSFSKRPAAREWSLWFTRFGARLILFTFGFYSISKRGKKDKKVKLLVSNHVGFLEILWFIYHDCPAFVMKRDYLRMPFVSQIATWVLGSVTVSHGESRGGGGAAAIVAYMQSDPELPLLVFPEPVVVKFPFEHFSPCWESITVPVYLLRLCSQVYNSLEVTYLPAQRSAPTTTIDAFAESVRTLMAKVLKVPLSPALYTDKREYQLRLAAYYKSRRCCPFLLANLVFPSPRIAVKLSDKER